ncbi:hypothetical protein EDD36DRAFT_418354 [Exophiala viscosa]|uniref:Uncharacterized protein n=1 Tax=Exophiala viscosa TaxID=2486360 RepID=A0AAN6E029_9EURO|nr:hypothetical protein EDD36DRAFT_418354 [Exophiala viscosa]
MPAPDAEKNRLRILVVRRRLEPKAVVTLSLSTPTPSVALGPNHHRATTYDTIFVRRGRRANAIALDVHRSLCGGDLRDTCGRRFAYIDEQRGMLLNHIANIVPVRKGRHAIATAELSMNLAILNGRRPATTDIAIDELFEVVTLSLSIPCSIGRFGRRDLIAGLINALRIAIDSQQKAITNIFQHSGDTGNRIAEKATSLESAATGAANHTAWPREDASLLPTCEVEEEDEEDNKGDDEESDDDEDSSTSDNSDDTHRSAVPSMGSQNPATLPPLTLALTETYSTDVIYQIRDKFMTQLASVDIHKVPHFLHPNGKLKGTALQEGKFSAEQIRDDPGVVLPAKNTAVDRNLPEICRYLFLAWTRAEESTVRENNFFRAIQGHNARFEISHYYRSGIKAAQKDRYDVRRTLVEHGNPMKTKSAALVRPFLAVERTDAGQDLRRCPPLHQARCYQKRFVPTTHRECHWNLRKDQQTRDVS